MNWTWTEIKINKLNNDIKSGVMKIPTYQRGLVWEKSKRNKLIETVRKGYPFGSILIYKYETDEGEETLLIDGLQRCSTLFSFLDKPSSYFKFTEYEDEYIEKIVSLEKAYYYPLKTRNTVMRETQKIIINYLKEVDDFSNMISIQYSKIAKSIIAEFPILKSKRDTIEDYLEELFVEFLTLCKGINNVVIPAIIYTGNSADLPEIFTRINESGKSLDKYQRFAATWADSKIHITNEKLYDLVKITNDFYIHHLDNDDIKVKGYNPKLFLKEATLNTFELCYSLGKLISKEFPALFGHCSSEKTIDSHGFNLINLSLGYHISKIENLNTYLLELGDDTVIEEFILRLIEAAKFVNKQISHFNLFKGNKSSNTSLKPVHSEFMVLSMIASVFTNRYMIFEKNNSKIVNRVFEYRQRNIHWDDMKDKFQNNLSKHYVLDILQERWMGSGDNSASQIILENNQYYLREITKDRFSSSLQSWFERDLNDSRNSGNISRMPNPSDKERLLLNVTYWGLFTAKDQIDEITYDIEHLIPKNLLKEKLKYFNAKKGIEDPRIVPSNIGNLCYLPSSFNRSKRDKTIYDPRNKIHGKKDISYIEKKYSLTSKQMFEFLDFTDWNDFQEGFKDFLEKRFKKIKDIIVNNLYN